MRLIDADKLIDDLKHDVRLDMDRLTSEEMGLMQRKDVQFDKDCKQNMIDLLLHTPTAETDLISVEEDLPEIGEYHVSDVVLCYCKGGVYAFSELEENIFGQKCFSCERDDEYHCNPLEVIAWMPLPKFNEEDEA